MANELAVRQGMALTFDEMSRAAKAMAMSGYFNDARDVSQAMVKVMAGAELGIGAFSSMTGISIIKGKPVLGANLIATLIKQDPRYDYRVKAMDDEGCIIVFYENGEEVGESSFLKADAQKAGLNGDNWKKFPRNMYFARAISNGAKWYTPGVFAGAPVYTADELGADVDEAGDPIIDVTPPARQIDEDTGEIVEAETAEWEDIPGAQPANGEPMPITASMLRKLHKVGTECYGPDWNAKRPDLVRAVTKGRAESSKELTVDEHMKLINGMLERLEAPQPNPATE